MTGKVNNWHCPRGLSDAAITDYYDKWIADTDFNYEEILKSGYVGTKTLVKHMKPHLDNITNLRRILDVGAGTGFLAMELRSAIGENVVMDALEPSTKMREVARARSLYSEYYDDFVHDLNSTSLQTETYACVCSAGCFAPSHIPKEGTREMMRLAKIGGLVAFIMRASYLEVEVYPGFGGFMDVLDKMTDDGVAEKVEVTSGVPYFGDHKGIVVIYRKIGEI